MNSIVRRDAFFFQGDEVRGEAIGVFLEQRSVLQELLKPVLPIAQERVLSKIDLIEVGCGKTLEGYETTGCRNHRYGDSRRTVWL